MKQRPTWNAARGGKPGNAQELFEYPYHCHCRCHSPGFIIEHEQPCCWTCKGCKKDVILHYWNLHKKECTNVFTVWNEDKKKFVEITREEWEKLGSPRWV